MTYNGLDEVLGWIDRRRDMKKHRYAGCIVAIALTPSYICDSSMIYHVSFRNRVFIFTDYFVHSMSVLLS